MAGVFDVPLDALRDAAGTGATFALRDSST
jgi:hypothetical protein